MTRFEKKIYFIEMNFQRLQKLKKLFLVECEVGLVHRGRSRLWGGY